jgi:hypothetical protein
MRLWCRCERPANRHRWFEGPAVSKCHLPSRLLRRDHSGASTEAGTGDGPNLTLGLAIVLMHRNQHCPHRSKDIVCGSNSHWYAHRGRVCDERVLSVTGFDNNRCSDRLLPQIVPNDPLVYSVQFASGRGNSVENRLEDEHSHFKTAYEKERNSTMKVSLTNTGRK